MPCRICAQETGTRLVCDECYLIFSRRIIHAAMGLDHHPGGGAVTAQDLAALEDARARRKKEIAQQAARQ